MIGWKEVLVVLVVLLLFFGKRLVNVSKDLGGAIGGFKKGLKEGEDATRGGTDADAEAAKAKAKADADGNGGQG
jgi:sec-independent protein translocase protein TatA